MKKILSALALVICTACSFSVANASPYFTTSYGYQLDLENTKKHQEQKYDYSQNDHGFVSAAVGLPVSSNLLAQVEYSKMKASANKATSETTQENISLVGILPISRIYNTVDLYALGGAGYTSLKAENIKGKDESAIAILGAGLEYQVNPTISLLSEIRTNYDVNINTWSPSANVGLKINIDGVINSALGR